MTATATKPRYLKIADELHDMIHQRVLIAGTQLFSRQELCERYGISDMTAFKVHAELQSRGAVVSVPGKGVFVHKDASSALAQTSGAADQPIQPLRRVYVHNLKGNTRFRGQYGGPIHEGILAAAKRLDVEVAYEETGMANSDIITSAMQFNPRPDEGFILLCCYQVQAAYSRILSDSSCRTSVIDTIVPGSVCVLSDNHHGMQLLIGHALEQGCERLVYAGCFGTTQNPVNENERREAFMRLSADLGVDQAVVNNGCYETLSAEIRRVGVKTAVLFSQDDPALVFKRQGRKFAAPLLVTGFDDIALREKGLERLTTYRVNLRGLGAAAVEALAAYAPSWRVDEFRRVRGELKER